MAGDERSVAGDRVQAFGEAGLFDSGGRGLVGYHDIAVGNGRSITRGGLTTPADAA